MHPDNLVLIQICTMLGALGVVMHGVLARPEDHPGKVGPTIFMLLMYITLALLIGYRDPRVGTDTEVYKAVVWPSIQNSPSYMAYIQDQTGVSVGGEMYFHFIKWVGQFVDNFMLFHVVILFAALWWFAAAVHKGREYLLSAYWLLSLPFWSLSINILRAGLCVAMLLLAIASLRKGKGIWAFVWMILGISFHYSAIVCLAAFAVAKMVKRRRNLEFALIGVTVHLALLSVVGIDKMVVTSVVEHFGLNIQVIDIFYQTGFRWDFALYNLAAYYLMRPVENAHVDDEYEFCDILLKIYLVLCGFFFVAFQFPYSDRVGMYSWLLIPIVCFVESTRVSEYGGIQRKLRVLALTAMSMAVQLKGILYPGAL